MLVRFASIMVCIAQVISGNPIDTQCLHVGSNYNRGILTVVLGGFQWLFSEYVKLASAKPEVLVDNKKPEPKYIFNLFDNHHGTCIPMASGRHQVELNFPHLLPISDIQLIFARSPPTPINVSLAIAHPWEAEVCKRDPKATPARIAEFHCQLGQERFKKASLVFPNLTHPVSLCEVNVTLTKEIVCCHTPPNPLHGYKAVSRTDGVLNYTFWCRAGYKLEGPATVKCVKNQITPSTLPKCVPLPKQDVQSLTSGPVPILDHCNRSTFNVPNATGWVEFTSSRQTVGSRVLLHCAEGYQPVGRNVTECWPNGVWSHVGNFEFKCKLVECPNVYWIPNGFVKMLDHSHLGAYSLDRFTPGSVISVHCNGNEKQISADGQEVLPILRFCGFSGQWVQLEQQRSKYAVSDLTKICASAHVIEPRVTRAYVVGAVTAIIGCISVFLAIFLIYCLRRRCRKPRPPSRLHPSLRRASGPSLQLRPVEHEYNSVIYEETPYAWNNVNASFSAYQIPHDSIERQSGSLSRNSSLCQGNIYTEPVDAKIMNNENEIYE